MESKNYTLKELKKKLTPKERIFCHEYIIDWNGARAARKAGYSEKGANVQASHILAKIHIQQYIDFIKDDIAGEAKISKLMLVNELRKLATANISDIHTDWITKEDFKTLKKEKPDLVAAIQEIETKVIKQKAKEYDDILDEMVDVVLDVEYVKIKLFDKRGVIQDLLKAMGWNEPDKLDLKGNIGTIVFENVSKDRQP